MVEWKKIWEVTTWDKKFQGVDKSMQNHIIHYPYLLAKDLFALSVPNGDVKLLSTGTEEGWTTKEVAGKFMCEGEVVSIPWGKSPGAKNPVKYYNGCFVTGDNRIATSTNKKVLNNRFLYFWLLNNSDLLETFYRGAGIQHPSMYMVLNMDVPILPLSEQTRIVGILDTFTASIENLKLQIAERRKQYEHYRDQLLDLEGKPGVEMKSVAHFVKERILANELTTQNYTSVENLLKDKAGRKNAENVPSEGNWIKYQKGDVLIGNIRPYLRKIWLSDREGGTNGDVIVIRANDALLPDFMFYCLASESFFLYYNQALKDGKMPRGEKSRVLSYTVPSISKEEQQRIVSILDTFEASIQNLEAQLKERQKQYEYYRNKLLTFE
jgi:type I restriction enzyme S subunit